MTQLDNLIRQAEQEEGRLAFGEAARLYQDALQLGPESPRRDQIRARLGSCLAVTGRWEEAEYELQGLLSRGDCPPRQRVQAVLTLGELANNRGALSRAGEFLGAALELADRYKQRDLSALARAALAEHSGRTGAVGEADAHVESGLKRANRLPEGPEKRAVLALLRTQKALCHFRLARLQDAEKEANRALQLVAADPPSLARAQVLRYMGVITGLRRKHRTAVLHLLDALDMYRKAGCSFGEAKVYESLGRTFMALNRMDEAIYSYRCCETLCQQLGARSELATLYGKLGQVYMLREDYATAAGLFKKDLSLSRQFRNPYALAYSCRNLGQCLAQLDRWDEAIENLEESLDLFRQVEDRFNVARVLMDLCQAYIRKGDASRAEEMFRDAQEFFGQHQMAKELAFLGCLAGSIARLRGDTAEAARRLDESIKVLTESGPSAWLADAHFQRAQLAQQRSAVPDAVEDLKQAVRIARKAGLARETGRYLDELRGLAERELFLTWIEGLRDTRVRHTFPRGRRHRVPAGLRA